MLLWVEQSLDPEAEAEVPTVAAKVFIVQKWTGNELKVLDQLG